MYKIRRCKECEQPIHIRTKGRRLTVSNPCIHLVDVKITKAVINEMCIPIREYKETAGNAHDFPRYCIDHGSRIIFKKISGRFASVYTCLGCKKVDKLIPRSYIVLWMKRTKSYDWLPGDVKRIISPSYNELKKEGLI